MTMLIAKALQKLDRTSKSGWSRHSEAYRDKLLLVSGGHKLSVDGLGLRVFELTEWTANNMLEVFTLLALELMKEDLRDLSFGPNPNYITGFCQKYHQFLGPKGTYTCFLSSEGSWDGELYITGILAKSPEYEYTPGAFAEIEKELFGIRPGTSFWTMRKMLYDKAERDDRFGDWVRGEERLFRFVVPDLGPEDKLQDLFV